MEIVLARENIQSQNALYGGSRHFKESWFQSSNWATLMVAMFQVGIPGIEEDDY